MTTKKEKLPVFCQMCGHNMARSRVKMSTNPMTVRCNGCKTVFEVRIIFPNPVYELRCYPGNHGTWLFVIKDGQTIFEHAGFKTDEEAKWYGKQVIERDKNQVSVFSETDLLMSKWNKIIKDNTR